MPLAVEVTGRDGVRRVEYAVNLSPSGIGLHVPRALPAGESLALAFTLPDGSGDRVEVRGRVAWTEAVARTERPRFREVGVRFEWLREADRDRLRRFVAGEADPGR